jgi:hypothetical protein
VYSRERIVAEPIFLWRPRHASSEAADELERKANGLYVKF